MNLTVKYAANPVYEAFCYLTYRVNGLSASSEAAEYLARHPGSAGRINELRGALVRIEEKLEKRIDVSSSVYDKFFRSEEGRVKNPVYSGNLASTYLSIVLHDLPFSDADEIEQRLLGYEARDRLFLVAMTVVPMGLGFEEPLDSIEDLTRLLNGLELSSRKKWECIQCFLDYDKNVKELMAAVRSAAKKFEEVLKELPPPGFGIVDESGEAIVEAAGKYSGIELDTSSDVAVIGSYMLFDGETYSVLKHEPNEARPEGWMQTTMYIGFSRFELKELDAERVSGESLAESLKTIADPTRLEILRILTQRTVYAKELCEMLNMSPSAISKHIAKLVSARLIDCRVDSVRTYYSLNVERVTELINATSGMILGK